MDDDEAMNLLFEQASNRQAEQHLSDSMLMSFLMHHIGSVVPVPSLSGLGMVVSHPDEEGIITIHPVVRNDG